jgi:hypothetical protein
MPECKNHSTFKNHSTRSTATSAAASTDSASADSSVRARSTKPPMRRVSASNRAGSSNLDQRLAELVPGRDLNLQTVQPCGALMARKWSNANGSGIQRSLNWRYVSVLPERERHDAKGPK